MMLWIGVGRVGVVGVVNHTYSSSIDPFDRSSLFVCVLFDTLFRLLGYERSWVAY